MFLADTQMDEQQFTGPRTFLRRFPTDDEDLRPASKKNPPTVLLFHHVFPISLLFNDFNAQTKPRSLDAFIHKKRKAGVLPPSSSPQCLFAVDQGRSRYDLVW
ncbi:hypothetical protein EVAR_51150_1 [Eumeta japonica]|uniref:Uncharacterized protein n=1 Tax=Eumeta variegata TaxID=151549 RepID=A0A4C1YQN1_EUMVA|nr:hypothetical protein EVAR_51150_1 [Eumeta japonica]